MLLASTISVAQGEVGIELVGCFADKMDDRALPILYANMRDHIIWSNMNETIKQCADAAANHDPPYLWFGVQFYGECWAGANAETTYDKHGPSTDCWEGVGRGLANAVYRFYEKE